MGNARSLDLLQLGRQLRKERERAGRTIRSVQDARIFSESKLARMETGRVPIRTGDVWALCRFYGSSREALTALTALADGAGKPWWEVYSVAVPDWFGLYLDLEANCNRLSAYHPVLVPGVLQTENYATAVMRSNGSVDEDIAIARLKVRLGRQRLVLDRPDRAVRVVLGAGALAMGIGSSEVMREQVSYLAKVDSMDGIDVRVLPWSAGAHPGMNRPFTVLDFDAADEPPVVYLEFLTRAEYLGKPGDVQAHDHAFQELFQHAVPIGDFDPATAP